jgi:outer membrane receptor protein involved in Fe transport
MLTGESMKINLLGVLAHTLNLENPARTLGGCAFVLILGACILRSADAAAADTSGPADFSASSLQEVIVTARRQNENLERVPVAIEAISTQSLAELNISTQADLQAATPGLLVRAATSTNQLAYAIRGQALDAFSYTSPSVITYFDEIQTGGVSSTTLYDLQSVQVLKGPQGTLFGRNATGGAVLYRPSSPARSSPVTSMSRPGITMIAKRRAPLHYPWRTGLRFASRGKLRSATATSTMSF